MNVLWVEPQYVLIRNKNIPRIEFANSSSSNGRMGIGILGQDTCFYIWCLLSKSPCFSCLHLVFGWQRTAASSFWSACWFSRDWLVTHSLPSEFLLRLFPTLLWFRVSWLEGNFALSFNEPESVWSCPLPVLFCPAASVMKSRVREGWESGLGTDLQPKAFSATLLNPSILRGNIEDLGRVINEPV